MMRIISVQTSKKTDHGTPDESGKTINHDPHEGIDDKQMQLHEQCTKYKQIVEIEIGKNKCETWYYSPFPEDFYLDTLYICEYCLGFFKHRAELERHALRCEIRRPPGNEIYRDEGISVYEVDGAESTIYCENLCFIAKLYLDHKTLANDVEPFLFYILVENDEAG